MAQSIALAADAFQLVSLRYSDLSAVCVSVAAARPRRSFLDPLSDSWVFRRVTVKTPELPCAR